MFVAFYEVYGNPRTNKFPVGATVTTLARRKCTNAITNVPIRIYDPTCSLALYEMVPLVVDPPHVGVHVPVSHPDRRLRKYDDRYGDKSFASFSSCASMLSP